MQLYISFVKVEFSLDFALPDILVQHMEEGGNRYDKQDIFRSIAEKTSNHIQVSDKYLPYSTERVVRISVKSSRYFMELHQAVDLMAKQLAHNITLFMCSPPQLVLCAERARTFTFQKTTGYAF